MNGYALGGGNELAMVCDIVIAGDTAIFGQPEVRVGLLPGAGGTQRLPRFVGKSLAMKMVLAGEPIDANAALAAGLVAEVVPADKTVARALELAGTISQRAPIAVRLAKEAVLAAEQNASRTQEAGVGGAQLDELISLHRVLPTGEHASRGAARGGR